MSLSVQLLGRPRIVQTSGTAYQFRSRKSWALLAYLLLAERPPTRAPAGRAAVRRGRRSAPGAALEPVGDPPRAWAPGLVDGDPVVLRLPPGAVVDVDVAQRGGPGARRVELPGSGADLLEGVAVRGAPAFEIVAARPSSRRVAAASEAILHEAAAGLDWRAATRPAALGYAVRAAAMRPLDENHQALVIRLYRLTGDDDAAEKQFAACAALLRAGARAYPRRRRSQRPRGRTAAARPARGRPTTPPSRRSSRPVRRPSRPGRSRPACVAADRGPAGGRAPSRSGLRLTARLALAEALIHSLARPGRGRAGRALRGRRASRWRPPADRRRRREARAELGYVDFLRARYDRAELWLTDALRAAPTRLRAVTAKATTYLGCVESDRGDYDRAHRPASVRRWRWPGRVATRAGRPTPLSMLGRRELLTGATSTPRRTSSSTPSIALAERDHWLAFLPWPQAMRGEVQLATGDVATAPMRLSQQAFARACQLGDPCWEGMSARALALVAEADRRGGQRLRRCSPTPAAALQPAGRSVRLAGRATSSTRSASSAGGTATRDGGLGRRVAAAGRPDRHAGARDPLPRPRRGARPRRRCRGGRPARAAPRQPCSAALLGEPPELVPPDV